MYVVMCFLAVQDKLNVSEEAAPQTFTHIRHMSPVPAKSLFRMDGKAVNEWIEITVFCLFDHFVITAEEVLYYIRPRCSLPCVPYFVLQD